MEFQYARAAMDIEGLVAGLQCGAQNASRPFLKQAATLSCMRPKLLNVSLRNRSSFWEGWVL